ncbi:MAG: thioesterase family protein [Phycisphaerales bacterium]
MTVDTLRIEPVAPATAFDGTAWDIPHPDPFLCELRVDDSLVSRAVPHVNNIGFVQWVDRVAELHADSLGYTRQELLRRGVMWFVVRHEIDYLAEAWPDDQLVFATWVRTMHRVKSWRDTVVLRPADQTVLCRAATLWVLVDLQTRRPLRHEPEMISSFAPLQTPQRCTSP